MTEIPEDDGGIDHPESGPFEDAVTLADILYGDAERPVQNLVTNDDGGDE